MIFKNTPANRLVVYKKMTAYFGYKSYTKGFCQSLIACNRDYSNTGFYMDMFPELLAYKPKKGWNNSSYWFNPERVLLRRIILTLIIIKMTWKKDT